MRQWLVVSGLCLVAVVVSGFFLWRVGVSNVVGSGQAHTEKTAVSTLRTLHWAQGLFQKEAFVDADGNGVGEFGTMEQLAALAPADDGQPIPAALVPVAGTRIEGGVLQAGGYCFRYELPTGTHERERHFVAVAWPQTSAAGSRHYCIDENEDILEHTGDETFFGCESGPPPGLCPLIEDVDGGAVAWKRWRGKTRQSTVGANR